MATTTKTDTPTSSLSALPSSTEVRTPHSASIEDILAYLKESVHFRKFNRIAYAYRVDEMPVVFITEKKNVETQYFEGHHSDETIEGSGEKLLHLLEKFSIFSSMQISGMS